MFSIEYENQASRFLKKLGVKSEVNRIVAQIEELMINPFPKETKRVEGYSDPKVFRVRVGNYRILYFVNYDDSTVYIVKIDRRERVY